MIDTDDTTNALPLACPVCSAGLHRMGGALTCPAGHSFDVAKEGYVNLMPSSHRTRGIDGDTQDMVQARRRFLEAGHYDRLLQQLSADVAEVLRTYDSAAHDSARGPCVLEVGCGEGYYVGNLARTAGDTAGPGAVFVGADVSKPAARLAARSYPEATFVVADVNRRIYVHDESVSVLLDVFAPRNPAEFARVLKPGGAAFIVIPSPSHLGSLRDSLGLLGVQNDKEVKVLERLGAEFRLEERVAIGYPIRLQAGAVRDLVNMGPNRWHHPDLPADSDAPITTEASFVILRLRRRGGAR